ncbi:Septin-10 [Sciurus carolinensis]|uniref:Septin-10 n=1 Tax=Sciurus carolinensis TaxID=30640 RepID=A0AA41TD23_SCICA|nr:Septin-10 [Sciurus carolinensis]
MLICTNLEDLQEQTHTRHYELYRCCKLEEMGFTDVGPENKPVSVQEIYEAKRHKLHGQLAPHLISTAMAPPSASWREYKRAVDRRQKVAASKEKRSSREKKQQLAERSSS